MPVYIEKINGDADRPTNRSNIEQSAFSKFETLEKRQRFANKKTSSQPPRSEPAISALINTLTIIFLFAFYILIHCYWIASLMIVPNVGLVLNCSPIPTPHSVETQSYSTLPPPEILNSVTLCPPGTPALPHCQEATLDLRESTRGLLPTITQVTEYRGI